MHIVLDETAMSAAGSGNILVSRLIHRAHAEPGRHLYAPPAPSSKPTAHAPAPPSTWPPCPASPSWTSTHPPS